MVLFATPLVGQSLVQQGDLIYHGAFRLPTDQDGGSRFGYGGTAPVYHPLNNSLFMVGHDWDQKVAEVSIPVLVISDQIDDLNTAEMLQPFRDISEGLMYTVDEGTIKVGGLLHNDGELIESVYTYYDADGDQELSHCISDTNIIILGDVEGMFELGQLGAGFVSGYMTHIPVEWQDEFGGPAITGQCCIPIISRSSFGPAAFVFDPDDLGVITPVDVTPLVYYPSDHPLAAWDATSPLFNGTTSVTGVVIPQSRRSLLFFGSHGIGEFCYGTGEDCDDPVNNSQGTHAYPYVFQIWAYDLLDLVEAKNGNVDPWEVMPYAVWSFDFPITEENKQLGGAAYDPVTGKIYVTQLRIDGFDAYPLVHVLTIRGPHIYVDSSATGMTKNGSSWTHAFTKLQDALAIAHAGDTIHIAKGVYYPDEGVSQVDDDRSSRFMVDSGIVVMAGYPAGGGIRDPALYRVVLSGDIDQNDLAIPAISSEDVVGQNVFTVVVCDGCALDGVTISAGFTGGTDPGGAGCRVSGEAVFVNCKFVGNYAYGNGANGKGGGLYIDSGTIFLRDVVFSGNAATGTGDAWFAEAGSVVVQEQVIVEE